MLRKRLLIICIASITTFLGTTNYLLSRLTTIENVSHHQKTIHEKIYIELQKLPAKYKNFERPEDDVGNIFINNLNEAVQEKNFSHLWNITNSWVSKTGIVDFQDFRIGGVLLALKTGKIIKADLDPRGTQLKLLLTLEGMQKVVFKPKWYDKTTIIEGPVYAGKDRYGSEVVAFYLSALLNLPFTPCSVQRQISFTYDILPVATRRLIDTSFQLGNRTCIYGKCFYCRKEDPICENQDFHLPGAVIFNIIGDLKSHRSPWQRTYKKSKKAIWEGDEKYCKFVKQKITRRRLLDLVDTSIFDFLIQNGDRHHYETLYDNVLLLDNGKGFGNPNASHLDILAPLYQCCILRSHMVKRLQNLTGGNLRKKLQLMPDINDLLSEAHLTAIQERLLIIFATIEYCKKRNKIE